MASKVSSEVNNWVDKEFKSQLAKVGSYLWGWKIWKNLKSGLQIWDKDFSNDNCNLNAEIISNIPPFWHNLKLSNDFSQL